MRLQVRRVQQSRGSVRQVLLIGQFQGRVLGVETMNAERTAARDLHDARQDLLEDIDQVGGLSSQRRQVEEGGQFVGARGDALLQGSGKQPDFGLGAFAHADLLLKPRHRLGQLGGTLRHLMFQPFIQGGQFGGAQAGDLGLLPGTFRIVRHLQHLQPLFGFFAGNLFLERLVLLKMRQCARRIVHLFVEFGKEQAVYLVMANERQGATARVRPYHE